MSLTLPTAYSNSSKLGNIQENWIVQLGFYNGDADGSGDGGWDAVLDTDGDPNLTRGPILNSSTTSIDIDDTTVFSVGDFILIDDEILKITALTDSDTLAVTRGEMSSDADTHGNNETIFWNNFTPISLSDTTVNSVFYHGTITSVPSIRSSISLSESTSKTGNISLSVVNFQFKGDDFSAELFLGTRKYINREVRIYSQLNGDSTLSNCLQVYSGRLIDISHDDSSVSLKLTEQRPWDLISIPQTKSTATKVYAPISYGNFTAITNSYYSELGSTSGAAVSQNDTNDFGINHVVDISTLTNTNLRPCPIIETTGGFRYYASGTVSTSDSQASYWDTGTQKFLPLNTSDNDAPTSTVSHDGIFGAKVQKKLERSVIFRPTATPTYNTSVTGFGTVSNYLEFTVGNPIANAYDGNASTYAEVTGDSTGSEGLGICQIEFDLNTPDGDYVETATDNFNKRLYVVWELTVISIDDDDAFYLGHNHNNNNGGVYTNITGGAGAEATLSKRMTFSEDFTSIGKHNIIAVWSTDDVASPAEGIHATLKIYDIFFAVEMRKTDDKPPPELYIGGDGLANSFTGGSGTADTGLEAHRDLLARLTGFDAADANIYNYDASLDIEAARITTAWNIRWWALEPIELKKVLEQMQYEFCFIFKWRHDGTGSYWFIKDSYSSGDVAQTLTKDDIANLQIDNTPFSELLTDMRISYNKHPAEDRYISSLTAKDTTNDPRKDWNIQSKENIKEINLDMNFNKPGNANPGGGDPNDGFADYYMNILGTVKKIITCDIVNPAVSYNLETGDIIQFSNTAGEMPVEPFGDNWADYYMITDLKRSPGKVSITVREVG